VEPSKGGLGAESAAGRGDGLRGWVGLTALLVVLATVGGTFPVLDGYFRTDDFGLLKYHWRDASQPLWSFFTEDLLKEQDIWGKTLYELRPVEVLGFRLSALLAGSRPLGHRAVNLAAHVGVALLVLAIARRLAGASRLCAAFVALLFTVLPVHAEAVGWISSRSEIVAAFFTLLSFLGYGLARLASGRRRWGWQTVAVSSFALALLTRESPITFLLLLPAWDLVVGVREGAVKSGTAGFAAARRSLVEAILRYAPFAAVLAGYLLLRSANLPQVFPAEGRPLGDLLTVLATRQAFYLGALIHPEVGLLLLPAPTLLDPLDPLQLGGPFTWVGAAVIAASALLGLWTAFGPRRPGRQVRLAVYFGPVWLVVTVLPLMVTYASDRHLYLPSVGFCLVLGSVRLLDAGGRALRWTVRVLGVAVLVAAWTGLLLLESAEADRTDSSREFHEAVLATAERVPPGSRLIIAPEMQRDGRWIWRWALPFALQPPFTDVDLYQRFEVIELSRSYCCPLSVWWRDREARIQRWIHDDTTPTTLIAWDSVEQQVVVRPLSPAELRLHLARSRSELGDPAHGAGPVTRAEAVRLVYSLKSWPGRLE
jgi:hypothetical protein